MSTVAQARLADQALLDAVARLVDEYDDLPAAEVLECFSRAVRQARAGDHPPSQLAEVATRLARLVLAGTAVRIPAPRPA